MAASVSVQSAASPEVDEFQTLLYGADPAPGVVAVEAAGETAILLRREAGALRREERPFRPWLLANEIAALADAEWEELDGPGCRFRARFRHWEAFQAGRAGGGPRAGRARGGGGGGGGAAPWVRAAARSGRGGSGAGTASTRGSASSASTWAGGGGRAWA